MKLTATSICALELPPGIRDKTFFNDDLPGFGVRVRAGQSNRSSSSSRSAPSTAACHWARYQRLT